MKTSKKEHRTKTHLKKLFAMAGVSAVVAAPLLVATTSAQAQVLLKDRPGQTDRGPRRDQDRDRDRDRGRDNRDRDRDRDRNRGYQTLTGRVTHVVSNQRFTLRAGSSSYNVVASSTLPRALKVGDEVRVYGLHSQRNDIRNANVTFLRGSSSGSSGNQGNWGNQGNQGNWGNQAGQSYRTYVGEVTDIDSNARFDLRVGNMIYNVKTTTTISRRLQKGDEVRVYGMRSGTNDIINANVSYIGAGSGGSWGNQGNQGIQRYQTFTGVVTDIDSNARFDIRVGNITYNVKPSTTIPRRLERGDEVRVYGLRSGDNDIINANVTFLRGGGGGSWGNQGSQGYQTFTGVVTDIDSNMRFDLRVGSTTYNVKPSTSISRRLERGDEVRVYGLRSGTNDIINANVSFIRGGRR